MTFAARPPVAISAAVQPSSRSMRAVMPSIAAAAPNTAPERIQSAVFLPMQRRGASNGTRGSSAAVSLKASAERTAPGIMQPPSSRPSCPKTVIVVVAAPTSTTMAGAPWLSSAPTASATRSAPSCDGSSMPMFRPVLTPAPTMSTRQPVTSSTASRSTAVTGGATLASTAPSNRAGSIPRSERLRSMRTAYSSAVRVARVSSERALIT